MNINYLKNFIILVENKSFSDSAKILNISQSTLSHQVSQLEKSFSMVTLINRTTKKFELTAAGKLLYDYSTKIVKLFEDCEEELLNYSDQKQENIIISASTIPGSHILPKSIADFKIEFPKANFKILINNSKQSIMNLINEVADFAGIGSFMNYKKNRFDIISIGSETLKFICSPKHELVKKDKPVVDFEQLIQYPFVWREKGSGMRETFQNQFPKYNELNIKLEINDNDSIISTVSASNYVGIMSEIMASKAENAGLIKILEVLDYPVIAQRKLYFLKIKNKKLSDLKEKFWKKIESIN